MSDLDEIRRCSMAIYLAVDSKSVADDISRILRGSTDEIEALRTKLALWDEIQQAFRDILGTRADGRLHGGERMIARLWDLRDRMNAIDPPKATKET